MSGPEHFVPVITSRIPVITNRSPNLLITRYAWRKARRRLAVPVVNDQWELTRSSLKGLGKICYYVIGAERLTETRYTPHHGKLYDWPIRIAQKDHFDYELHHFSMSYKASSTPVNSCR